MRVESGAIAWACLCVATLAAAHDVSRRDTSGGSKRVVCYYTNWSVYRPGTAKFNPQNINPYLCTHLIYAFGGLTRENGLRPYDKYQDIEQGGYAKFTGLKTYNKQLKTMLAIGGWNEGSTRFSPLVASVERRGEFVKNVVRFLRQNHFDGLDLDWEYPAFRDGGKARDRDNYALLVQELREEFNRESSKTGRPRLLLTMAVPAGIEYIDKGYDIPKLNKYLDFMNILSYDYHSSFEPSVNHHSPLYPLEEEGEYNFDAQLSIDYTINHYLELGADRDKLVLGIPTYGRSYTLFNPLATEIGAPADGPGEQGDATREKGYLAYYEICENLQNSDEWKVEKPNPKAMGPYAYKDNQWVGYDDEDIVRKKARYVTEMGLGGIMYWAIDNDDFRGKCHGRPYPLIEAGKEAMLEGSGTSNDLVSVVAKNRARPRARVTTEDTPVRNSGGGTARKPSTKRRRPSSKPRAQEKRTSTTSTSTSTTPAYVYPAATPEPPTTPDPGSDFKCEDEGFFPHPRDCKKYFWCLDSGPSNLGIVAHQFTCPSGLFFNKAADSCDYTRNVVCNKKTKETPTTSTTTLAPKTTSTTSRALRTTTTTTTTEAPEYEEEYEEYEDEPDQPEEDPKAIKELIDLIKKLGGIENLEKQLHLDDSGKSKTNSVTPPAIISKKLYDRVLSQANSRANSNANFYNPSSKATTQHTLIFRNRGRQNEGLDHLEEVTALRHEKPQYVTITRNRPTTPTPEEEEDEEDDAEDNVEEKPRERAYVNIRRDRPTKVTEEATTTPKYVTLRRTRPSAKPEVDDVTEAPVVVSQNTRSSSAALVQELTPTVPKKKYNFAPRTPKRGILPESKETEETEEVTVANEKEENTQEIVKVTTEDQKPEVSGSNQKKYVEIARGRGSTTVAPTEAELTTVNIPSEPSSSPVDVDVTLPYVSLSTVTDETLNEKTDILPVQTTILSTSTTAEPTSAPESVTKKSRFFKSSTSSTQSTPTEGDEILVTTETPISTSTSAPTSSATRGSIKRNRFFSPSSSVTRPTTEVADSLTLDNSTSAAPEDLSTPVVEVKRNRFFRPSANKTQTIGGKIDSFTTNSSTPSSEEVTKRNRFFRPTSNKTQLSGDAVNSLPVNNISSQQSNTPTSSPDDVTKRSRFYRPSLSLRQRTEDHIGPLSIESLFSSSTSSESLSSSPNPQRLDEENESVSDNNIPLDGLQTITVSTTTPFTPTVTRVVTSVTESGTTERQRISLSKYKGFYLTVDPPVSSTPPPYVETAYQVATEHTTTAGGVLFANLTDKMEKIMEVNRIKQVTFTDDGAVPFTKAVNSNETTVRPTQEVKSEKTEDKVKEITRLSHITVVDGEEVTSPTLFDTDLNITASVSSAVDVNSTNTENQKDEQTNEISQNEQTQHDTTQSAEPSVTTPRVLNRGRTRVRVRASTTRAPIPNGLRTSLQRRRTTTLRPGVNGDTESIDDPSSGRKTFVPRGRGVYRPISRTNKDGETRSSTESGESERKKFRPRARNDEQNSGSDTNTEGGVVPQYKSRVRNKPLVTERTDEYSQEEQTTYLDDTNTSTNFGEEDSENSSSGNTDRDDDSTDTYRKPSPQYKNRSRTKQVTENPGKSELENDSKSSTRSQEETARLFPRLRTTQKTDKNTQDQESKSVTRSQEETAKLFPRLRTTQKTEDDIEDPEYKSVTRSQEETAKLFPRLRTTEKTDEDIEDTGFKSVTRSQEETAKLFPRLRTTQKTEDDIEDPEYKSVTRSQEETAKLFPRLRTTEKTEDDIEDTGFKSVTRSQEETAKLFPRLRTTQKTEDDIEDPEYKSVTRSQEETAKLFPRLRTTQKTEDDIEDTGFKSVTRSQEETAKLFPRLRTTEKTDEDIEDTGFKSVTRSQEETAKLFPRLRTTQKTEDDIEDPEFKSVTQSEDDAPKLFPRLKTTFQVDDPIKEKETESHTRSQEDTDKLFPRRRVTDVKQSTSIPPRSGSQSRNRSRGQSVFRIPADITQETVSVPPRRAQVISEEVTGRDSSAESKRGRVVKKRRKLPQSSSSITPDEEIGLTTAGFATSTGDLEPKSATFGQRETTSFYTTDSFSDLTTETLLETQTDSNTVFDNEFRSTPPPSESVLTTLNVDAEPQSVRGRDELLETQYSSISLDSSRRGSQKFSLDSSEDEDSNAVTDDPSLNTNFFKKYLTKPSDKNLQDNSAGNVNRLVEGHAGAKRRRVIKKKLLPTKSTEQPEEMEPESLQTEVSPSTTRTPLRRPGGSFLANSRLRTRATSTTTSTTTTEASVTAKTTRRRGPSPSSRLNIVRRRKFGDNSSITEQPTSERGVATSTTLVSREKEVDAATIEPSRKFNFPRRRTKVINRGKVVATSEKIPTTLRLANDSQNEPSTIEDVQTLEPDDPIATDVALTTPLPDLANVAVVAIHQLAIQPSIRPFKREKSIVGTRATYHAQSVTLPTTPKISTTVVPAYSTTATPFYPHRGTAFYVSSTAAPVLTQPQRESDPFKPRPFSKITAAVHPNSQSGSLEDYEYYDAEGLLDTMPSAGKVKIHGDGYIECLDQGSFPHPFSCKQFISCAKMENGEVLGWEYTCPRHLSYDPIGGICNWSAGLGCKE